MSTSKTDILFDVVLIDLGTGHNNLRIGKNNSYLIAATLDVLLGEFGEIDVGFDLGIHRDGDLSIGQGDLEVELFAEELAFEAQGIVVGDDLVDAILGGVEVGAIFYLKD